MSNTALDSSRTPLVSVVIPVYNGETTIARAVESALAQDYPNLECVVVNDASRDRTAEILASFGDRIHVIENPVNRGTAGAYNEGSAAARGEYLLLMASDCCLTDPGYIRKALEHFSDPTVAAVCGQGIFDHLDRLDTIQRLFTVVNVLDVVEDEEDVFEVAFIETRCDLIRKKALEDIGFWFEGLYNSTEDQDISARIRQRGYRLLQDKRLKFALDFGQTEDSLPKVIKKQYKYAHGQGYIFLKYGLGHHTMSGNQKNRRLRIAHRAIQIGLAGSTIVLGIAALLGLGVAGYVLALLIALRAVHYWWQARPWLGGLERFYAAGLGIVCDLTYGLSFLAAVVTWPLREPSLLRPARGTATGHISE